VSRVLCFSCLAVLFAACQSVTSLDKLDIEGTSIRDAAVSGMDAAPPLLDAAIDAMADAQTGAQIDVGPICLVPDGAECDVVSQCGCEPTQHCQARTSLLRATCVEKGSHAPWSRCQSASECPTGQTCDRGSCRSYCAGDSDCEGGRCFAIASSDPDAVSGIEVCWKQCQPGQANACAAGTTCRSVRTPDGSSGAYCVAPSDPCPSEADGVCDDSSGTGQCADGTDSKDCNCTPTLSGASCDPIKQCGCAAGLTCDLQTIETDVSDDNVLTFTGICAKAGNKPLYAECSDAEECARGLTCDLNVRMCVNICASDADCIEGACKRIPHKDDGDVGLCTPRCDRTTNAPCLQGTTCASFDRLWSKFFAKPGDYCWLPVQANCATGNGCDEPQGSGICVAGSDPEDC